VAHYRVILLVVFAALIAKPALHSSFAITLGGRVWNDLNRNGLRDEGEPGIPNQAVYLTAFSEYEPFFGEPMATNFTDSSGRYEFNGVANHARFMSIYFDYKYRVTARNMGTDENLDNNFYQAYSFCGGPFAVFPLTDPMSSNTNIDAGVFALVPSMNVSVSANGKSGNVPLYVTNGAMVDIVYTVTNSGETALSYIYFFDEQDVEGKFLIECPSSLGWFSRLQFTNRLTVTASMTNQEYLIAFPVEYCSCSFHDSDPLSWDHQTVIIVVTNLPDFDDGDGIPGWWEIHCGLDPLNPCASSANSDSDWMTDFQEYIADTNPTNSASHLPIAAWSDQGILMSNTSTNRVYNLWWSTNLLNEPQAWNLHPDEQLGSGAGIVFTITNDAPAKMFRTGVRLP